MEDNVHSPSHKMTMIELNEFNENLLRKASSEMDLPNIRKLLLMNRTETFSVDKHEFHGLDPWLQWVSIHCGSTSKVHGLLRNGESGMLKLPQIWEVLDGKGISSGLWGLMNARRGRTEHCRFFLPDPWTYDSNSYPNYLERFIALPRYYSKNYLAPSKYKIFCKGVKTLSILLHPRNIFAV